mgnify:CR=1 FL=1
MKQGRIIILSGPSGVGKGTVLKRVMQSDDSLRFSVSATTRPIRPNEIDGVHYFFMDKAHFEGMIERGERTRVYDESGHAGHGVRRQRRRADGRNRRAAGAGHERGS